MRLHLWLFRGTFTKSLPFCKQGDSKLYTRLHCLDYVRLAIYSRTGLKTAVILKAAELSSLRRTLGTQSRFPADVLPVTGSNQSQSSFVRFYSFPLHHNCKY